MSALGDYYQAQAAEKYAGIPLQRAQAQQIQATTDQIDPNAAATRALQGAQAGLYGAQASAVPLTTAADVARTDAGTQGTNLSNLGILPSADSALTTNALNQRKLLSGLGSSGITLQQLQTLFQQGGGGLPGGAEKGTSKVKAAGANGTPGKTDTVPMMLAPGEAVLNKHAVDHYGTGVIAHMNKMGLMRGKAHKEIAGHFKKIAKRAAKK